MVCLLRCVTYSALTLDEQTYKAILTEPTLIKVMKCAQIEQLFEGAVAKQKISYKLTL
jgi:hypothetical protein